jgi:hypothetical protein
MRFPLARRSDITLLAVLSGALVLAVGPSRGRTGTTVLRLESIAATV